MAAGRAAESGAETLLLGKTDSPGCKLRLTGNGRCNLTNTDPLPEFIRHFRPDGRFLRQAFAKFFSAELMAFFKKLGVPTVTEQTRVFPAAGRAADVADALVSWVRQRGVTLQLLSPVQRLIVEHGRIVGVGVSQKNLDQQRRQKQIFRADAVIIAAGGASYPSTGSSGDGCRLAESVGHTIVPIRPALVPLETAGDIAPKLQGLALSDVTIRVLVNGKKLTRTSGEMLFTHFGLSGPVVLSLSGRIVDQLRLGGKVTISIDLKPALDEHQLDTLLVRKLADNGKKHFSTLINGLLPRRLCDVCCESIGILPEKQCNQITAAQRRKLKMWLKGFYLDVSGHRSFNEAMVTAGGVSTKEIDPRTMASRLVKGLYFAGEVLDIDGDTGGYNLQAAFSTGFLAGQSAAQ
jgi:hypothetical protein